MNKKLLIALGILIVLIVGLVYINYVDYHRIIGEGIAKQMEEQLAKENVVTIGENTVKLYSTSATYLGYSGGYYYVRFKGSIAVWSDEPMAWRAGFDVMGNKKLVTVCNPGSVKTFTYTRAVYCNISYWWRTYAVRIDGQASGYGPYGPSFRIPCQ